MIKGKLNIEKIRIQSFVTSLNSNNSQTVKGGGWTHPVGCTWAVCEQGATNEGDQTC